MGIEPLLFGWVATLPLIAGAWGTATETAPTSSVRRIASFTLSEPRDQTRFSLADCTDRKAVVLVFLGTECRINNAYLPRLAELHRDYADLGVQFIGINSNCTDSAPRVAEHARKYAIPFPVLKDPNNTVADQLGAQRTPEALLLDASGFVRYQGRIDDRFGIGYERPRPTRHDLVEAIGEVLVGRDVSRPTTPVVGCFIARVPPLQTSGAVTFTKDVVRILQEHCQECHRPGQVGPMPLLSYDDAAGWAATIREVVRARRMPPWYADPHYGTFSNDRRLSQADHDTLLTWIDEGCPRGDAKDLPPPRPFADGWHIGTPDLVVTMSETFAVPARAPPGGIPYQYFRVDPGFTEDRWVVQAEVRPGAPEVVHHVLVFILPPGKSFKPGDPLPQNLCTAIPGETTLVLPKGMARRVPAHSQLLFQIHYSPNGTAQKDRSSVALIFSDRGPQQEVLNLWIANTTFRIPPEADHHCVEAEFMLPQAGRLLSFHPHMHLRGKDFLFEAVYPDGQKEILLSVPTYNFNWQCIYRLVEAKRLPKGTRLYCVAHFDNSANNLGNPDPTRTVTWGDQTWDEMMVGIFDLAWDSPGGGPPPANEEARPDRGCPPRVNRRPRWLLLGLGITLLGGLALSFKRFQRVSRT